MAGRFRPPGKPPATGVLRKRGAQRESGAVLDGLWAPGPGKRRARAVHECRSGAPARVFPLRRGIYLRNRKITFALLYISEKTYIDYTILRRFLQSLMFSGIAPFPG